MNSNFGSKIPKNANKKKNEKSYLKTKIVKKRKIKFPILIKKYLKHNIVVDEHRTESFGKQCKLHRNPSPIKYLLL